MLAMGTGSEIRQPLGYTIVGGLALSWLLTLYTTPVVYIYLDRLSQFLGRAARVATACPLAHSHSFVPAAEPTVPPNGSSKASARAPELR